MSEEGAAEQVFEAGLELVNPGGQPDVLRAAAKGYRDMGEELKEVYGALNKQVRATIGDHWRGDSADAFDAHWKGIGKAVHETTPLFEQAADGLDKAADDIEKINKEIHEIYLEIGVSIGASVALSFVTLGFSAAAGAANAARLGVQAANAATKLGKLLSFAARTFRAIRTFAQQSTLRRLTVELGVQWAAGTGTGMATSYATKGEFEVADNVVNGAVGALGANTSPVRSPASWVVDFSRTRRVEWPPAVLRRWLVTASTTSGRVTSSTPRRWRWARHSAVRQEAPAVPQCTGSRRADRSPGPMNSRVTWRPMPRSVSVWGWRATSSRTWTQRSMATPTRKRKRTSPAPLPMRAGMPERARRR